MSSREKFEQAIKSRFGDLIDYRVCKNSDGEYMDWDMQVAWWAWQASEASTAERLANTESKCRELAGDSPVIPDGWKLVPIDPTKDMLRAGQSVVGFWLNTVHCYSKMLAASPAATQQEAK